MKRPLSEAQRAATKERREKFRHVVKEIAAMSEDQRLALAGRLSGLATCEGHVLSLHNTLLLALQIPGATVVGGFRQWKRQGRTVRKGEHGSMIWIPIMPGEKSGADDIPQPQEIDGRERSEIRFMVGTVFDIAQTEPLAYAQEQAA